MSLTTIQVPCCKRSVVVREDGMSLRYCWIATCWPSNLLNPAHFDDTGIWPPSRLSVSVYLSGSHHCSYVTCELIM